MDSKPDFEHEPLTRKEYIDTLIHLYRGEMQRTTTWRLRLDNTTNWSVVVTITALSYAFASIQNSHAILLISNQLVLLLLYVEARRYRFYDLWRTRIRKLEENFFAPILRRDLQSQDEQWGMVVADDFLHPRFKIKLSHAVKVRLTKNYLSLFGMQMLAWLGKVYVVATAGSGGQPLPFSWERYFQAMAFHAVPAWLILLVQVLFALGIVSILVGVRVPQGYSVEIHEVTPDSEFWDR